MIRVLFFLIISVSIFALIPEHVLICGVCKNVEKPLPHTIKILRQWAEKNKKVYPQTENVGDDEFDRSIINIKQDGTPFHPETIARARNIVLDIAMSDQYKEFPYIIWMDMDLIKPPAFNGIKEVFQTDREWDAVFAYGVDPVGNHWDWYAYRDHGSPIGAEFLGHYRCRADGSSLP